MSAFPCTPPECQGEPTQGAEPGRGGAWGCGRGCGWGKGRWVGQGWGGGGGAGESVVVPFHHPQRRKTPQCRKTPFSQASWWWLWCLAGGVGVLSACTAPKASPQNTGDRKVVPLGALQATPFHWYMSRWRVSLGGSFLGPRPLFQDGQVAGGHCPPHSAPVPAWSLSPPPLPQATGDLQSSTGWGGGNAGSTAGVPCPPHQSPWGTFCFFGLF